MGGKEGMIAIARKEEAVCDHKEGEGSDGTSQERLFFILIVPWPFLFHFGPFQLPLFI
jgi:hypothetical protein